MTGGILSDCWNWWRVELLDCARLVRRYPHAASDNVVVNVLRGTCLIERRSNASSETLEGASIERVGERTKLLTNTSVCTLAISDGRYISRRLIDRRLPFTRGRQIAAIDLTDGTPFEPDDVHLCFTESSDQSSGTRYFLIRKDVLNPVIENLMDAGVHPQSIVLKTPDGEQRLSRQSLQSIHPVFRQKTWLQQLVRGAFCLLVVSGVVTFAHAYYRYSAADEQLTVQVNEKQKAAREVRKVLDRRAQDIAAVEAARKSKEQAVPVVRVWEELTRTLPDTAWITDFNLNGDSLSFSGFANSAAGLIPVLAGSLLFADPSFTSPVVRIPGQSGERFAIKLNVVRK